MRTYNSGPTERCLVKQFIRNNQKYTAVYSEKGGLFQLMNDTTHNIIPPNTQTFRRLADNNRGNKFTPMA